MRQLFLILSLLIAPTLYGQKSGVNSTTMTTDKEQLNWGGTYQYKTNPYDTLYGFYTFHLQTLSYSKNGSEVWVVELPERMRGYEAQSMYDKITDSAGTARKLRQEEVDVNKFYFKEFLNCPAFLGADIIALSDRSGFLLLNKHTGSVLADITYSFKEDFFRCDQGSVVVKTKKNTCKETTRNGSSFIVACGGNLFHFNEQELFVWNDKNILLKRIRYQRSLHSIKSNLPLHYKALFRTKDFRVEMEGLVFVE